MNYKAIVSDWNGTLFYDATDEEIHKEFAYELLRCSTKRMLTLDPEAFKIPIKLLESGLKIRRKYEEYNKLIARKDIETKKKTEEMKRILNDIYEIFNKNILIGRS